ncbi:MAG: translation elongation factor-like protein [Nanoarchaeota archaeon]|nr:translation elongation factor-like protein [Nanoarchaeota archaeon]
MEEKQIGTVTDYFKKIEVAAITLTGNLKKGDKIHIKGATTDFEQNVESIQIKKQAVEKAKARDEIGIKVNDRVRKNDKVFLA